MTRLHILPLFGVGGARYSRGIQKLAEKIRTEVGAEAVTYPWAEWNDHGRLSKIIRAIKDPDRVMLIGHSGGANETTIIARDVAPAKIDLIVAYHLSWWMRNRVSVGKNVDRVIEIYGWNFFNPRGRPLLESNVTFRGTRENIYSRAAHTAVDDDTGLHTLVVDRVVGMMKQA